MNKRNAQGSFIVLIWTLIGKVKELAYAPIVLIPPRAAIMTDLLLRPVITRSKQRRLAEDASSDHRVYRFSSVDNATTPCWSAGALKTSMR